MNCGHFTSGLEPSENSILCPSVLTLGMDTLSPESEHNYNLSQLTAKVMDCSVIMLTAPQPQPSQPVTVELTSLGEGMPLSPPLQTWHSRSGT